MNHGVIVIGDPARAHGIRGTVVDAVTATRFDNGTDTWTVDTADGRTLTGRVLVDTTASDDDVLAVHGVPNRFRIPGPHTARQARYVARLIETMNRGGSTRIEARSRLRVHRLLPTRGASRFYLTGAVDGDDEIYDGPAVLIHHGDEYQSKVRLTGHFDPIDGHYHWQGMLYDGLPEGKATGAKVEIRIGEHSAHGKISEQTPWGTLSVVGAAGYPPFPLDDVEISMPPRI